MKIYDISVPISKEMLIYPGDSATSIIPLLQISKGQPCNISTLSFSSHVGTHIDPPYHFLEEGAKTDTLPLEIFIGKAWVCEFNGEGGIGAAELSASGIPPDTERLLLKTRNSQLWQRPGFQQDYAYLAPDGARWLVEQGVRLVGIDYLSIEKFNASPATTHLTLLGAGVPIIEGLDLSSVTPGEYTLICLPLRVKDGDGAPARAVLIEPRYDHE